MNKRMLCGVLVLILVTVMALTFSACGNGESKDKVGDGPQAKGKKVDIEKLASDIVANVTFRDQIEKVEVRIPMTVYGLEEKDVEKCVVYMSTGATAEEVAIFEAKSENAAKKIEKQCKFRVESQRSGYENYQPEELKKLATPVIHRSGKYVLLCICDDVEKVKSIIEEAFKQ